MPLTAVTGLKVNSIRRSISYSTYHPTQLGFPPNIHMDLDSIWALNIAEYPLKKSAQYDFDLEWTNPNFGSHVTELTILDSGVRRQISSTYLNSVLAEPISVLFQNQNWQALAQLPSTDVDNFVDKLYYGITAPTGVTGVYHKQNFQNSAFVGGNQLNTYSTVGCRIYFIEGDAPRTVTVTVTVKDGTESQSTTITQQISLSSTVSLLSGGDGNGNAISLGGSGTVNVKYLDPFVKTENDRNYVTTTLLGQGSQSPVALGAPLYSASTDAEVVKASGMQLGKFYKISQSLNFGTALTPGLAGKILRDAVVGGYSNIWNYYHSVERMVYALKTKGLFDRAYFSYTRSLNDVNWRPWRYYGGGYGEFNSTIDLQYLVISAPLIETTTTPVVRTVVNQSFSYVVKATTGGAASASSGATSFRLGTLPTGITATIDSSGTITGTTTAVGSYTLPVFAINGVGTVSGSIVVQCRAFVGDDLVLDVEPSQPISAALAASTNATFSLLSTSSNVPSGGLILSQGVLSGILHFEGSYTATIRATSVGLTPVVTDDFTVSISVKKPQQPLGVRATNVVRVLSPDKQFVSYYGDVQWFNTETKPHTVRVDRVDAEGGKTLSTSFPYKSTSTGQLLIGTWYADTALSEKSFQLRITAVGNYSSSEAGLGSYTTSLDQLGSITGQLEYDELGGFNLPSFDLVDVKTEFDTTAATLSVEAGPATPAIFRAAAAPNVWAMLGTVEVGASTIPKTSLQFTTIQQVYGLKDGGKYFLSLTYNLAGALSSTIGSGNKKVWTTTSFRETVSASVEYYYRGLTIPQISSPLSVKADLGATFQYDIEALGTKTFSANFTGLTDFYVNPSTGMIEGLFTTEGVVTIPISATNAKGTTTRNLVVTVRDFYADAKNIRAKLNRLIREKLQASRQSSWTIVSGAPTGLSIIVDSVGDAYLTGSVAATGSYSVVLRATQLNYTPTRYVDVTYSVAILSSDYIDPFEDKTIIVTPSNLSLYNSEKPLLVGDRVKLAFKSDPPFASWIADGLPPGLSIDAETGAVSGVVRTAGSYVAQINATAVGRAESLPLVIAFEVDPTTTATLQAKASGEAINRFPWLASKWDLIDLQILARSRVVQSSLSTTGDDKATSLKFKIGDDLRFGVFFIDGDNAAFAIQPSRVRLTIRPINNVDDPLILETVESPSVTTEEDTPYYVLTSVRGVDWNAESMSVVEDWVLGQQSSKTTEAKLVAPLNCVAEIEWIKDGKSYSSESFPVSVELDVNR